VIPPPDSVGCNTDTLQWSESVLHLYKCGDSKCDVDHPCWHVYTYQVKLTTTQSLAAKYPNGNNLTFKSGYGFSILASTAISQSQISNSGVCGTSRNRPNSTVKPIPPETAVVTTTWTVTNKDKTPNVTQPKNINLARISATTTASAFECASNPLSNFNNKLIYTDVALAGTKNKPVTHNINLDFGGGGLRHPGTSGITSTVRINALNSPWCKTVVLPFTINGDMYEDFKTMDGKPI
jgi:hypothetical protein